ncbi:unnamed protein product [Rhizoctonia solani]|uniref:Vacuolar protein sorting-associated protein 68 n=1 Tax=Rhizoctonia solani TaxID=456999 RepID=A0A8H2X015_9AGAM|nr:vacuolar protein sorting-associated protein 68 [Rhizoctonia solani]QRW18857.1 vacuolar protein sorting-associated protein 68 [Rhizoctonia solani]CAE6411470.1 unnamed protein product [Rhizoctonia solani]
MSLPHSQYDPRRVCIIPFPTLPFLKHKRALGVYTAGALFAFAHWVFLDACILSSHARPPADSPHDIVPLHVTFLDWIPGICSTLGMLVVNLVNKEQLLGEGFASGDAYVRRARIILFVGFALMAGGLAGSVVVLVLKYILAEYGEGYNYYGYANVVQNVAIMLSAVVLWLAQNSQSEYEYNLTL